MNPDGFKSTHFLLIEDDPYHADLISVAFQEHGPSNTLTHVPDGAEALNYLQRIEGSSDAARPDVILLDLKLPKVDGHEVLSQLKQNRTLRTIPVVILTTSDSDADRAKAYANSVNSYVIKPIEFDRFKKMITDLRYYWSTWNQSPVRPVAIG
jgi:hypothetical protein